MVISQLEDIFRMHHHKRNSFTVVTMKNTKNLEQQSSAVRITCFLPLSCNPLDLLASFTESFKRFTVVTLHFECMDILEERIDLPRGPNGKATNFKMSFTV